MAVIFSIDRFGVKPGSSSGGSIRATPPPSPSSRPRTYRADRSASSPPARRSARGSTFAASAASPWARGAPGGASPSSHRSPRPPPRATHRCNRHDGSAPRRGASRRARCSRPPRPCHVSIPRLSRDAEMDAPMPIGVARGREEPPPPPRGHPARGQLSPANQPARQVSQASVHDRRCSVRDGAEPTVEVRCSFVPEHTAVGLLLQSDSTSI